MGHALFLDRDGVLMRAFEVGGLPRPPATLGECEILSGVRESLEAARAAGYQLIVVTNQPDVARGLQKRVVVRRINEWLQRELPLDAVYTCYHDDVDCCPCRKPKPGMLLQAARDFGLSLRDSVMVGDRWSDVEAGRSAGCGLSVLIERSYSQRNRCQVEVVVADLSEAVGVILHKAEGTLS